MIKISLLRFGGDYFGESILLKNPVRYLKFHIKNDLIWF